MPVKMNDVGTNAGMVWRFLHNNPSLSRRAIQNNLGLTRGAVESALGWLAREDKLIEGEVENKYIPNTNKISVFSVHD